jgi:hypothetical protein
VPRAGYPEIRERRVDMVGETVADLIAQVQQLGVDPSEIRLGHDRELFWESPQTPEERTEYEAWLIKHKEWEAERERARKGDEALIKLIGLLQKAAKEYVEKEEGKS